MIDGELEFHVNMVIIIHVMIDTIPDISLDTNGKTVLL